MCKYIEILVSFLYNIFGTENRGQWIRNYGEYDKGTVSDDQQSGRRRYIIPLAAIDWGYERNEFEFVAVASFMFDKEITFL